MYLDPSFSTVFWVLLARYSWYFGVTCIVSANNHYNLSYPVNFYRYSYLIGEAAMFFMGFYTNLLRGVLGDYNSFANSNLAAAAIAIISYVGRYQLIKHLKTNNNVYDFMNSKYSEDEKSCEAFFNRVPACKMKPESIFAGMKDGKTTFIKAIVKRAPSNFNAPGKYCYTGLFDIFSKSQNMLEAYILGSSCNQFYCDAAIVTALVDAGVDITKDTRQKAKQRTLMVKNVTDAVVIDRILNQSSIFRNIVSEDEIPADIRSKVA